MKRRVMVFTSLAESPPGREVKTVMYARKYGFGTSAFAAQQSLDSGGAGTAEIT
jgi:hypothetical protein